MNLYAWLKLFHLLGLAVFLFAHGVAGGASLALRAPVSDYSRRLLQLSRRSAMVANPGLLVVIATGVWMAFMGEFWGRGWIWAAIAILVVLIAIMVFIARPYYLAREAAGQSDQALSEVLNRTRPMPALWIGGAGIVVLIALMVLKPF